MAKVLSCIAKPSQDGTKTYYNVALQKGDAQIGAFAFEQVQPGEEIDDSRIIPDKQGTGWVIKSAARAGGKGNYQKNDDSTRAQCAFKGMVDLIVGNKMAAADLNSATCIRLAGIIKTTEDTVKSTITAPAAGAPPTAPLAGQPPSAHGADPSKVPPPPEGGTVPQIKSMGELRTKIHKEYPALKTVAAQDAIIGKDIKDFDAAFQKVVEYMEKEI